MGPHRGMSTQLTITPGSAVALAIAMAVLAALPSTSVFFIVGRAGTGGSRHGLVAALGIVAGDIVHLLVALLGGGILVKAMGPWWSMFYWIAGAYLFALTWGLKGAQLAAVGGPSRSAGGSQWASFLGGLFITLGDQKAIFFYLGFLPGFVDLTRVSKVDIVAMVVITTLSVGGVKAAYAVLASEAPRRLGEWWVRWTYRVARVMLVAAGLLIWARALGF